MRPDEPRSTTTVQRNERFAAESRRMTTFTERIVTSCGAIDVKKRYSAYARLSSLIGILMPDTVIRIK